MKTALFAFKRSIPVLAGYLLIGIAFGVMMSEAGFHWGWSLLTSLFVYAGSMQFLLVSLLREDTAILLVVVMTLFINSRHLFYGIGFIERYRNRGLAKPYLIHSLTDETFSVLATIKYDKDLNVQKADLYISVLHHCYWILGTVLGALLGNILPLDFQGIEFAMSALFLVLLTEQWRERSNRMPILVGVLTGIIMLIVLGPQRFIFPAILLCTGALLFLRKSLWKKEEAHE